MDYYYTRVYIHSTAIQALVDRISNDAGSDGLWQHHELWRTKYAQEFASVNEVRESSRNILNMAVELGNQGFLQCCPVRVFLRVVSASVFLLKSMSLGSREADINASLDTLEKCINVLQINRADDIHLSNRYATLISRHVQRFKRNFRVGKKFRAQPAVTPFRTPAPVPVDATEDPSMNTHQETPSEQHQRITSSWTTGITSEQFSIENQPLFGQGDIGADLPQDELLEDWLLQPFDPQLAPFGIDYMALGGGLAVDSLDFLWNISDQT
jgi:hypothetical protein